MKDFQRLAASSEADGHLQQKLKQLLKLSKEKWDAACEHSKSAVQACPDLQALARRQGYVCWQTSGGLKRRRIDMDRFEPPRLDSPSIP